MAKTANVKRSSYGLRLETFKGKKGTYLVLTVGTSVHTFLELEAKQAAVDCGSTLDRRTHNTPTMWNDVRRKKVVEMQKKAA